MTTDRLSFSEINLLQVIDTFNNFFFPISNPNVSITSNPNLNDFLAILGFMSIHNFLENLSVNEAGKTSENTLLLKKEEIKYLS